MAKKSAAKAGATVGRASRLSPKSDKNETGATPVLRPSSLLDIRVVYCVDNLEQLAKLPDACATSGLGTNWVNVASSTQTNQVTVPLNSTNGSVFFRLVRPY